MKISLNWLAQYVALPADVDELARRLTMAGLEIEAIDRPGEALSGVVVGQILASEKHPNAEKLSVTTVDIGGAKPLQIVCGAKNYQVGDKVPVATIGTRLPNGTEIKQAPLRGIESHGMLCSARELAISDEHEGLMILDPSLTVGTPIAAALKLDDVVFEVNVTPNRADALCHVGIAREVATLMGSKVTLPPSVVKEGTVETSSLVTIRIEDSARCLRFDARVIEGVKVGPSPGWMQARLKACGVRAINNLVDITNYVNLEYGQPMHAYDLDRVAGGQLSARLPKANETLTTLDGKQRALNADDLLIADRDQPLGLAGVMGAASSEVTAGGTCGDLARGGGVCSRLGSAQQQAPRAAHRGVAPLRARRRHRQPAGGHRSRRVADRRAGRRHGVERPHRHRTPTRSSPVRCRCASRGFAKCSASKCRCQSRNAF